MIEIPHLSLSDNLTYEVNRIFFEYKTPDGISDQYLQWIRDGYELERFTSMETIDIDGILIRATTSSTISDGVHLFDAHPSTPYKEFGIKHEWNDGRFVDSFLNSNEVMDLPSPINLRIEVTNTLSESAGFEVSVTRVEPVDEEGL